MQNLRPVPSALEEERALDVLEARVAQLETRVFGAPARPGVPFPRWEEESEPAAEALGRAHSLLQAATSGHEKVGDVMHRRLPELEACVNAAVNAALPVASRTADAQWELVQREEPALKAVAEDLRRLDMMHYLLDPLPPLDALQPRLSKLGAGARDCWKDAHVLASQVVDLQEQQYLSLKKISQSLILLEKQVSIMEAAARPKPPVD